MAELDIAHAKVRLDDYTVVYRGETNPLNWVEIEYLWFVHGERALSDIVVVDTIEAENMEVLENLRLKYGAKDVSKAFPGQRPRLPMKAPDEFRKGYKPKKKRAAPAPKQSAEEALSDIMAAEQTAAE